MRTKTNLLLLLLLSSSYLACEAAPVDAATVRALEAPKSCAPDTDANRAAVRPVDIDVSTSPILGPRDAPITVVVYSDFECPFCKKGAARLAELSQRYAGKIRIAFKHNPLPFHERAPRASAAAIAAGHQGKFWEMHDRIFAEPGALDDASFRAHAAALGLDLTRFAADMDDPATQAKIDADLAEGAKNGVRGTPTFFVDGKIIAGAQPIDAFIAMIEGR